MALLRVKVKNISVNSRLASEEQESLFENVHHAQQLPCLVRYTNSIVVLHTDWHFVCAGSIDPFPWNSHYAHCFTAALLGIGAFDM